MTSNDLRDRLITEGEASAKKHLKEEELEGALEGFALARTLQTIEEFKAKLDEMEEETVLARNDAKKYWKLRYRALQLEYIMEVLKVGQRHLYPSLSARAMARYAEIVGVSQ